MLSADFIAGIKIVFLLWPGLDKEHEHFLILFFFFGNINTRDETSTYKDRRSENYTIRVNLNISLWFLSFN